MNNLKYLYQLELQWIGQDASSGAGLFKCGSLFNNTDVFWQTSVDFILRCLKSDLIVDLNNSISCNPLIIAKTLANEPINILQSNLTKGNQAYWHWVQFNPTSNLLQVLKNYNLDCWESPPNIEFITWLENRFVEYDVPFSDEPLVLIQPPKPEPIKNSV